MMLKILQGVTVGVFALFALLGGIILFFAPEKLSGYLQLVGTLAPWFTMEVIPAFLGKPLKEIVCGLKAKMENDQRLATNKVEDEAAGK